MIAFIFERDDDFLIDGAGAARHAVLLQMVRARDDSKVQLSPNLRALGEDDCRWVRFIKLSSPDRIQVNLVFYTDIIGVKETGQSSVNRIT